ncbi:MAG: DUF2911 domain-containing protein [Bacteroidota bacterium]
MKKIKIFAILLWILMLILTVELANAQSFSGLDKESHDIAYFKVDNNSKPQIRVLYGRPRTENESVFGTEIPYGKIWKTGTNEATEIKFYQDVMFGNKYVKAGTYVLYTIPNEDYWTIILNSNTDTYGAYFYNSEKDIARLKVPATNGKPIDIFSIGFNSKNYGTQMVLAWGKTRVKIPLYTEEKLLTKL